MKIKQNSDLLSKRVFSYKLSDPRMNAASLTREPKDENLGYWKSWRKQNKKAKDVLRKMRADRRIGERVKKLKGQAQNITKSKISHTKRFDQKHEDGTKNDNKHKSRKLYVTRRSDTRKSFKKDSKYLS